MDTSRSYLCPSIPFYLQLNTRHTSAYATGTRCSMHRNTPCLHQLALSQPPLSKQITALEEHIVQWTADQIFGTVWSAMCLVRNAHTTLKKTRHKTQKKREPIEERDGKEAIKSRCNFCNLRLPTRSHLNQLKPTQLNLKLEKKWSNKSSFPPPFPHR